MGSTRHFEGASATKLVVLDVDGSIDGEVDGEVGGGVGGDIE